MNTTGACPSGRSRALRRSSCSTNLVVVVLISVVSGSASAGGHPQQAQPPAPQPAQPTLPQIAIEVTVVGTTPLPGEKVPVGTIPAPVQTATARDLENSGALDLSAFLNRRMNGVYLNEIQNNPFQVDLNYRGYTASPLLGTPQGMSIYLDGVRLNQPFGDIVSWDLIPRIATATTTLIPGSNPLFGLNTLGGAVALETKSGLTHRGTTAEVTYGSDLRRGVDFEHGGFTSAGRFHWYAAGRLFAEDGWRDESPSEVRQLFGKVGWQREDRGVTVALAHADNSLNGNGLQDVQLLARDRASIYTKPDITDNRSTLVNASARHRFDTRTSLEATAYYRHIRSGTFNGDINEESLDQSMYQPGVAERAALAAAGYGSVPSSGLDASNTPFPSLRCIANVLLNDEPGEKCNGLINRTESRLRNGGISAQLARRDPVRGRTNTLIVGGAFDRSGVDFMQSTQLGYLNPDRSVIALDAFADGVTGGDIDGEPYDARVDLGGHVTTWSAFAYDLLPVGSRAHVTLAGRYNHTSIENRDRITPGGGPGSLDGSHTFGRFNPAAGVTVALPRGISLYAGYSEGSRAPTSIELGCADPEQPCKLPNAMAGDPPLEQVVTRTLEAGLRGMRGTVSWTAGFFGARNHDDILFVTSEQTGFGYFRNFGETRRRGLELDLRARLGPTTFGAGYTLLDSTFESEETVNGESNASNDEALEREPGLEGRIEIEPGDRTPITPRHLFKAFVDAEVTARLGVELDLVSVGGSFARGNENNDHEPDGTYYLGPGSIDGYAIVTLAARFRLTKRLQILGHVGNVFDADYASAAQLGPSGITESGSYIARPLPPIDGEFPVRHTTFVAPGAPRRAWIGMRIRF
jgi:outer membrane receptor protein involved in Fe transport